MLNIKGLARLTIEDFKQMWRTFSENVTDKSYSIGLGKPLKVSSKKLIGRCHIMEKTGADKSHTHTVLIARDEGGFFVHCGTIAGESPASDAVCSFFTRPYVLTPHNVGVCKHIKMLFSDGTIRNDYLDILLDEMESDWQHEFNPNKNNQPQHDPLSYLDRFAFRLPVLIEGDRGSGKTYEVHEYAKRHSLNEVFVGGHAGIESIDLLGHLVPAAVDDRLYPLDALTSGFEPPQTQMIWKDGALTEAFRKAASGERVILILDELLRVPQRELNILLSALTPIDGRYTLRTGRVISVTGGIAAEEVLHAPIEQIFIVATTNIGGSFEVDDIDPALAERFMVIRKDTTEEQLRSVLRKYSDEKGYSENLPLKLTEFYSKMKTAKREGFINNLPTTRTLSRAIQLSFNESDVWELVRQQKLLWIGRDMDGFPIEEQMKQIDVIITQAASMT